MGYEQRTEIDRPDASTSPEIEYALGCLGAGREIMSTTESQEKVVVLHIWRLSGKQFGCPLRPQSTHT